MLWIQWLLAFRNLAYDDFIAVAEDLIARKVTSANKLGKWPLCCFVKLLYYCIHFFYDFVCMFRVCMHLLKAFVAAQTGVCLWETCWYVDRTYLQL
jgi:hypothetical protein